MHPSCASGWSTSSPPRVPPASPFVVIEAIKLVEAGLAAACDEVWIVECGPETQRARLSGRGVAPDGCGTADGRPGRRAGRPAGGPRSRPNGRRCRCGASSRTARRPRCGARWSRARGGAGGPGLRGRVEPLQGRPPNLAGFPPGVDYARWRACSWPGHVPSGSLPRTETGESVHGHRRRVAGEGSPARPPSAPERLAECTASPRGNVAAWRGGREPLTLRLMATTSSTAPAEAGLANPRSPGTASSVVRKAPRPSRRTSGTPTACCSPRSPRLARALHRRADAQLRAASSRWQGARSELGVIDQPPPRGWLRRERGERRVGSTACRARAARCVRPGEVPS